MTFHPFVLAYGQRRGYSMADLNRIFESQSSIFTSSNVDRHNDSPSCLSADLTLNLSDPSAYLKEISLFAAFYNSLPIAVRLHFRSYANDILTYFGKKLSKFGHPSDILQPVTEDFQFPPENDQDMSSSQSAGTKFPDINQLLKNFLIEFRTPLLCEYFRSETSLLSDSNEGSDRQIPAEMKISAQACNDIVESEKEDDDIENPPWWRETGANAIQEDPEPKSQEVNSILEEIRGICSKLPADPVNDAFPFTMKLYSLSTNQTVRGRNRSAAVCADVSTDGRLACFGCDGDSTIRCYSIRNSMTAEKPFLLRAGTSSGIVYRIGIIDNQFDGSFLLSTSDEVTRPIELFDLTKRIKIYDYRGHQWPVWALDTTRSAGGMFATGSYDRTSRLFTLDRKDPIRVFVGHESTVDCVRFVPSPKHGSSSEPNDGYPPYVATASSDGTVRLWSITDAIAVRVFHGMKGYPTALAYRSASVPESPEKLLACASNEGKIFVWELESGHLYQTMENVLANDLHFSADGRYLLAGGDAGCFKVYQLTKVDNSEFGNQYLEIHISENLIYHNIEAKFLKIKMLQNEIICLAA